MYNYNIYYQKKTLFEELKLIRRYLRRDFENNLEINSFGEATHNSCISHCLRHAFGDCDFPHPDTCTNCEKTFSFFDKLNEILPTECH